MKRIALIIILLSFVVPVFAAVSGSSIQLKNGEEAQTASVNLKLALKNASYYQMGFTTTTIINDSLVTLTAVRLVPYLSLDILEKGKETVNLSISDDSKTIRGYWLILGNDSFDIRLKLSTLNGRRNSEKTLGWKASWKGDDNSEKSIVGGGESELFYSRNYRESKEIQSTGSKMITFEITEGTVSLDTLYIDSYSGYITMEVVAI